MGNSSSKALSSDSLRGDYNSKSDDNISSSTLQLPKSSSHRRSRSASATRSSSNGKEPPPPPYSPATETSAGVASIRPTRRGSALRRYLLEPMRRESAEEARETLRDYDTVIIVDNSASMHGRRWSEVERALASLSEIIVNYDDDGIDIHFLNYRPTNIQGGQWNGVKHTNLKSSEEIIALFKRVKPSGNTPIAARLEKLMLDYISKLEKATDTGNADAIKPVNYIVLTDGAPTDDPESVITANARRLDARHFPLNQVGIQFVQIGNDPGATRYLQELDDQLQGQHGIRDIIDTTPYLDVELTGDILTKILVGGINRRIDKRTNPS